jgi:hypothetical protein
MFTKLFSVFPAKNMHVILKMQRSFQLQENLSKETQTNLTLLSAGRSLKES